MDLPVPSRSLLAGLILAALLVLPARSVRAEDTATPGPSPAEKAYEDALDYAEGIETGLVKSVSKVRLNSVTVFNLRRPRAKPDQPPPPLGRAGGGSGVIIKRNNKLWILTNVHVTAGHQALEVVTHDGVTRSVIQHDSIPEYDIALLRFSEKPKRVKFKGVIIRPGKSEEGTNGLSEGTWVLATGNPFFLAADGTAVATLGVISGLNRFLPGQYAYVGAIQHDAEVNPGNSGGPLWNLNGDLVGINGKIVMGQRMAGVGPSNTGASFSLPIHQVDAFLKRLVGDGDAEAGYLGVQTETATDKHGKAVGALIKKVLRQSPLLGKSQKRKKDVPRKGDVITYLTVKGSGNKIETATELREVLSLLGAGTEILLKFKRGKSTKRWKGKLGDKKR